MDVGDSSDLRDELLPLSAEDRVRKIKKAIRGDNSYNNYAEHKLMEKFSIGYNTLMEFPYERYLEHAKILHLETKEEQKEQKKQETKMNKHT